MVRLGGEDGWPLHGGEGGLHGVQAGRAGRHGEQYEEGHQLGGGKGEAGRVAQQQGVDEPEERQEEEDVPEERHDRRVLDAARAEEIRHEVGVKRRDQDGDDDDAPGDPAHEPGLLRYVALGGACDAAVRHLHGTAIRRAGRLDLVLNKSTLAPEEGRTAWNPVCRCPELPRIRGAPPSY